LQRLNIKSDLGQTGLQVPPIIFGTSSLGNLYTALPYEIKLQIIKNIFHCVKPPVVLDTAGKYGAGLALEMIGNLLCDLEISEDALLLSNKLGWLRIPLKTAEPTFEPGAWIDLDYDAEQDIGYDGILRCWEQGKKLLKGKYQPQLVSVHDPDEYLARASTSRERKKNLDDIINAYRALSDLKEQGETVAVGIGSKDWKTIPEIAGYVELDWVMIANSLTIYSHPPELLEFVEDLNKKHIGIINSAVFNAGFLTGGDYFDYIKLNPKKKIDKEKFRWREKFLTLCKKYNLVPADVCVQFGLSPPGVVSVSMNTSKPERIEKNISAVCAQIPDEFWDQLKQEGLILHDYPYL
jgi:D-threo-aldose 1-dehydrogenase